jgi:hypothetical protein
MDTHLKVLGVLQIAMGCLSLCAAIVILFVLLGGVGALGFSGDPDAQAALPLVGFVGTSIVTLLVVLSLPGIVTGIGLLRRRPWARIIGIVLSVLSLMAIPFGTIVGVYGLWVLFSKDTERLFEVPAAAPPLA